MTSDMSTGGTEGGVDDDGQGMSAQRSGIDKRVANVSDRHSMRIKEILSRMVCLSHFPGLWKGKGEGRRDNGTVKDSRNRPTELTTPPSFSNCLPA
jgi:hypothetical protein